MAEIRIKDLANTTTSSAADDYIALDGTAQGTRKILASELVETPTPSVNVNGTTVNNPDLDNSTEVNFSANGSNITASLNNDTITEAKLDISNAPTAGQFLQYADGTDQLTWVAVPPSGDSWGDPVDAHIIPDGDETRDLGSTNRKFNNCHFNSLNVKGNIAMPADSLVDGRDVSTDGVKLDTIPAIPHGDGTYELNVASGTNTWTTATAANTFSTSGASVRNPNFVNTGDVSFATSGSSISANVPGLSIEEATSGTAATSTASGTAAVAIGDGSSATGTNSSAIGRMSAATGTNSSSFGISSSASGIQSTSIGANSESRMTNSVAIGTSSDAGGAGSVSIGLNSGATGSNSVSIGTSSSASGNNSISLGSGAASTTANTLTINNIDTIQTPGFTGGTDQYISLDASGNWGSSAVSGGSSVSVDGTAVSSPNLTDSTEVNFTAAGSNVSAALVNESITEAKLDISNAPAAGQYLQYRDSTDQMTWVNAPSGGGTSGSTVEVEGTERSTVDFVDSSEINVSYDTSNNEVSSALNDNSIAESRLSISNPPQNGQRLQYENGRMTWSGITNSEFFDRSSIMPVPGTLIGIGEDGGFQPITILPVTPTTGTSTALLEATFSSRTAQNPVTLTNATGVTDDQLAEFLIRQTGENYEPAAIQPTSRPQYWFDLVDTGNNDTVVAQSWLVNDSVGLRRHWANFNTANGSGNLEQETSAGSVGPYNFRFVWRPTGGETFNYRLRIYAFSPAVTSETLVVESADLTASSAVVPAAATGVTLSDYFSVAGNRAYLSIVQPDSRPNYWLEIVDAANTSSVLASGCLCETSGGGGQFSPTTYRVVNDAGTITDGSLAVTWQSLSTISGSVGFTMQWTRGASATRNVRVRITAVSNQPVPPSRNLVQLTDNDVPANGLISWTKADSVSQEVFDRTFSISGTNLLITSFQPDTMPLYWVRITNETTNAIIGSGWLERSTQGTTTNWTTSFGNLALTTIFVTNRPGHVRQFTANWSMGAGVTDTINVSIYESTSNYTIASQLRPVDVGLEDPRVGGTPVNNINLVNSAEIDVSAASNGNVTSTIVDDSIAEVKLDISNTPTAGQFLQYADATDQLTWATPATGSGGSVSVDGTAVSSPNLTDNTEVNFAAAGSNVTATLVDDSIVEAKLDISNAPAAGQFLQYRDATDQMTWVNAPSGSGTSGSTVEVEGTERSTVDFVDSTEINVSYNTANNELSSSLIDDSITEAKLDISNTATDGQFLQYTNDTAQLTWATPPSGGGGTPLSANGTAVTNPNLTGFSGNIAFVVDGSNISGEFQGMDINRVVSNTAASSTATGAGTIAIGDTSSSTGLGSVALGKGSSASGSSAISIGVSAANSGRDAIAVGPSSNAAGISGIAIGNSSRAAGEGGVAVGPNASASHNNSVGIGARSIGGAANSIAIGDNVNVSGTHSIGIGEDVTLTSANTLHISNIDTIQTPAFTGGANQYISLDANGNWGASTVSGAGPESGDAWSDNVDSDIIPDGNGTRDIGHDSTRFRHIYSNDLTVTTNIAVGGNISITGNVDGRKLSTDGTKLDGIEASADVTDIGNVSTALTGAVPGVDAKTSVVQNDVLFVQDSLDARELKTITVDRLGLGDSWGDVVDADIIPDGNSTRDLGSTANRFDEAYVDDLTVTNNIVVGGTVDSRDLQTDGTKLDGIEAAADVTDRANVTTALSVTGITEKTSNAVPNDRILLQDSADTNALKTILVSRLGAGSSTPVPARKILLARSANMAVSPGAQPVPFDFTAQTAATGYITLSSENSGIILAPVQPDTTPRYWYEFVRTDTGAVVNSNFIDSNDRTTTTVISLDGGTINLAWLNRLEWGPSVTTRTQTYPIRLDLYAIEYGGGSNVPLKPDTPTSTTNYELRIDSAGAASWETATSGGGGSVSVAGTAVPSPNLVDSTEIDIEANGSNISASLRVDSINESKLSTSNVPTNGQYLQYADASRELTWVDAPTGGGSAPTRDPVPAKKTLVARSANRNNGSTGDFIWSTEANSSAYIVPTTNGTTLNFQIIQPPESPRYWFEIVRTVSGTDSIVASAFVDGFSKRNGTTYALGGGLVRFGWRNDNNADSFQSWAPFVTSALALYSSYRMDVYAIEFGGGSDAPNKPATPAADTRYDLQITSAGAATWQPTVGGRRSVRSYSSGTITATATDDVILYTGDTISRIDLPTAVGLIGKEYTVVKTSVNTNADLTIDAFSNQTIGRSSTYLMGKADTESVTIMSDGTNWQVLSAFDTAAF